MRPVVVRAREQVHSVVPAQAVQQLGVVRRADELGAMWVGPGRGEEPDQHGHERLVEALLDPVHELIAAVGKHRDSARRHLAAHDRARGEHAPRHVAAHHALRPSLNLRWNTSDSGSHLSHSMLPSKA